MTTTTLFRLRLAALIGGILLIGANSFVLGPILSDVAATLDTSVVSVARALSAFGGATAISAFFLSKLIDRFETRIVLSGAALVMAVAFAGSGLSASWQMLCLFQAFAGLATGVLLPAIYAEAVQIAPEGEGARTLGVVLSGWSIALMAGVPVSALLTDFLSWRFAFLTLCGLSVLVALVFASFRNSKAPEKREVLSLRAALNIPGVKSLLLTCFCFMSAFYGTYALLGHHIREVQDINASLASTAVIAYGLGFGLAGMIARQVDRLGPGRVFPFLLAGSLIVYLSMIPATEALWSSLLATLALGFTNHFGLNLIVLRLAGRKPAARGTLIGLNITVTYIAVFCGPLLMGWLYAGPGFAAVSVAAAILLFICAALMWRIRKLS